MRWRGWWASAADIASQLIQVVFQVRVAVGGGLCPVRGVIRVEAVGHLPAVGDAVAVAIERRCAADQDRIGLALSAAHPARLLATVALPGLELLEILGIERVACRLRGAHI